MSSSVRMLLLVSALAACSESAPRLPEEGAPRDEDGGAGDSQLNDEDGSVDAVQDARIEADAMQPDASEDAGEGDADVTQLFGSGARLRLQGYASEGALLAVENMFDRKLNIGCSYRLAPDGRDYCMPDVEQSLAHAMPGYADDACSKPLLVRRGDCAPPQPYHLVTEVGCRNTTRVFRVATASDRDTWYSREPEGCVAHAVLPGQRLHDLSSELPTSELVEGKRTLRETTRLAREVMAGSDGSWLTLGMFDLERSSCAPTWLGDGGGLRCVPSARAYLADDWFAGPQCTQPVAFAQKESALCEAPSVVVRPSFDVMSCQAGGLPVQLLQVGARAAEAYTYDLDASCKATPESTTQAFSFYLSGAPFDGSVFPPLELTAFGSGRLRAAAWSSSRKALQQVLPEQGGAPLLYDDQLGSTCQPTRVAGELVCAPIWALLAYGDGDCTTPLLEVFESEHCAVALPEVLSVRTGRADGCGVLSEYEAITLHRRGASAAAPASRFVRFQSKCVAADSPAIHARYFELGEALPGSTLARLQFVTD